MASYNLDKAEEELRNTGTLGIGMSVSRRKPKKKFTPAQIENIRRARELLKNMRSR